MYYDGANWKWGDEMKLFYDVDGEIVDFIRIETHNGWNGPAKVWHLRKNRKWYDSKECWTYLHELMGTTAYWILKGKTNNCGWIGE